jgi:hypothetical protein
MRIFWSVLAACGLVLGGFGLGVMRPANVSGEEADGHPHMRHALTRLREAHKALKESKHNFGGHRVKAIKDVDHAIHQVEEALKHK